MPFTIVTLSQRTSEQEAQALAATLSALLETDLGKDPRLSVVRVHAPSAEHATSFVGDAPAPSGIWSVQAHITAGTTTREQRSTFVAHVYEALAARGHSGGPAYVVVHELEADTWGYDGSLQAARTRTAGQ